MLVDLASEATPRWPELGVYPALAPPGSVMAHGHDQRDQGFQGFRLLGEPLAVKPDSIRDSTQVGDV